MANMSKKEKSYLRRSNSDENVTAVETEMAVKKEFTQMLKNLKSR